MKWFLRISAALMALLVLGGCDFIQYLYDDIKEDSYGWDITPLSDGWVYSVYAYAYGDTAQKVIRTRSDGSQRQVFLEDDFAGCAYNNDLALFPGPTGGLGVIVSCGDAAQARALEYPTTGGSPTRLADVPDAQDATWAPHGVGYVEVATPTCHGIRQVGADRPAPTVTLHDVRFARDCGSPGTARVKEPVLTPDGHTLLMLATVNDSAVNFANTQWQLMRSVDGADPVPVGAPLVDAGELAVSPDGRSALVITGQPSDTSRVVLIPLNGGPARELLHGHIADATYTMDGRQILVTRMDHTRLYTYPI